MHRSLLMTLTLALAAPALVHADVGAPDAAPLRMTSGPERVALIELYTSEGCSSCPPADRWLSSLEREPGLWRDFVPIALHVDYWDELGWPDRFADAAYSARQRRYATEGGTRVVYTPGVFRDGQEWRRWRGARPGPASTPAGTLVVSVDGQRFEARYSPLRRRTTVTLHVALLGLDLETAVGAGENRGRRLEHDFVVLALQSSPMRAEGTTWRHAGALLRPAVRAGRYAIASWVTAGNAQAPLQATGGFLPARTAPAGP